MLVMRDCVRLSVCGLGALYSVVGLSLPAAAEDSWVGAKIMPKARVVDVSLPKFKVTTGAKLAETLMSMGIMPFDRDRADFSTMIGRRELCMSEVIHNAFVDVNEEGTEAAAATAVILAPGAGAVSRD
jgi:serine protease inhibitor